MQWIIQSKKQQFQVFTATNETKNKPNLQQKKLFARPHKFVTFSTNVTALPVSGAPRENSCLRSDVKITRRAFKTIFRLQNFCLHVSCEFQHHVPWPENVQCLFHTSCTASKPTVCGAHCPHTFLNCNDRNSRTSVETARPNNAPAVSPTRRDFKFSSTNGIGLQDRRRLDRNSPK